MRGFVPRIACEGFYLVYYLKRVIIHGIDECMHNARQKSPGSRVQDVVSRTLWMTLRYVRMGAASYSGFHWW